MSLDASRHQLKQCKLDSCRTSARVRRLRPQFREVRAKRQPALRLLQQSPRLLNRDRMTNPKNVIDVHRLPDEVREHPDLADIDFAHHESRLRLHQVLLEGRHNSEILGQD